MVLSQSVADPGFPTLRLQPINWQHFCQKLHGMKEFGPRAPPWIRHCPGTQLHDIVGKCNDEAKTQECTE